MEGYPTINTTNDSASLPEVRAAIALITNEVGQIFVSTRRFGSDYENSLEFPGGKVEEGETPRHALHREIEEELGIQIIEDEFLMTLEHVTKEKKLILYFFRVLDYIGEPFGREDQEVYWLNLEDLDPTMFPPANYKFINKLKDEGIALVEA